MALTAAQEKIYHAANRADDRFSNELERVYGKRAGDMRYHPERWTDSALKKTAAHFHHAMDRWMKVMRSFRTSNPSRRSTPRGTIASHREPRYPVTYFAAWNGGGTQPLVEYVEDANGEVWSINYAVPGARWRPTPGTRAQAEEQIRAGTWRNHGELISPRVRNPSRRSIHTAKWDRCVKDVKAKGGAASPYAVCTSMLGEQGGIKAGHRRKNPVAGGLNADTVYVGQRVTYAGYPGTVKRLLEYTRHGKAIMVEVQLKSGGTAVPASDLLPYTGERVKLRTDNPSGFQLEKTQRLYFVVHAHPHKGGGERLWLTKSGALSAHKDKAARYTSVEVAVARAKALLKKHPSMRKYRFDVCISD